MRLKKKNYQEGRSSSLCRRRLLLRFAVSLNDVVMINFMLTQYSMTFLRVQRTNETFILFYKYTSPRTFHECSRHFKRGSSYKTDMCKGETGKMAIRRILTILNEFSQPFVTILRFVLRERGLTYFFPPPVFFEKRKIDGQKIKNFHERVARKRDR